jgi:TPR repeat protein
VGWGTPRNYQHSIECYQRAAGKGQLDAKNRLENRHSFTRHQHEEVLGNRENVIQLDGGTDGQSGASGSRISDDCIVM